MMLSLWAHTQSGELVVLTYNLSNYLKDTSLTRQHHFQFLSTGEVIIREYSESLETKLNLLKDSTWRPASTTGENIMLTILHLMLFFYAFFVNQ